MHFNNQTNRVAMLTCNRAQKFTYFDDTNVYFNVMHVYGQYTNNKYEKDFLAVDISLADCAYLYSN